MSNTAPITTKVVFLLHNSLYVGNRTEEPDRLWGQSLPYCDPHVPHLKSGEDLFALKGTLSPLIHSQKVVFPKGWIAMCCGSLGEGEKKKNLGHLVDCIIVQQTFTSP